MLGCVPAPLCRSLANSTATRAVPSISPRPFRQGVVPGSPSPSQCGIRGVVPPNPVSLGPTSRSQGSEGVQTRCNASSSSVSRAPDGGNGVFFLILANVVIFLADHVLHLPGLRGALYLHHAAPEWWQFVTHAFCHGNLPHLSGNMFNLLVFGKMVEETEGAAGVITIYILTALGAAGASFFLSGRSSISVGASGAVFGLFATSVLLRLMNGLNLKRLLEAAILGNFVIRQVWDEVHNQLAGGLSMGGMQVAHIAHLGGALAGVLVVWFFSRLPAE